MNRRDRETDRETDRQTERQTDLETKNDRNERGREKPNFLVRYTTTYHPEAKLEEH